jgi:hypothetical protein
MKTYSTAISTQVKHHAVIKFLNAEVTPTEIHHHLKAVYCDNAAKRSTVNQWLIKFCGCKPGKGIIVDETGSRQTIITKVTK